MSVPYNFDYQNSDFVEVTYTNNGFVRVIIGMSSLDKWFGIHKFGWEEITNYILSLTCPLSKVVFVEIFII